MDCSMQALNLLTRLFSNHPTDANYKVILGFYVAYLGEMSEQELPQILLSEASNWRPSNGGPMAEISPFCVQELKKYLFTVPTLKKLPEGQHAGINKYRPVREFVSFLVRLLYHKTGSIVDLCGDQITSLEKELRFLLTVLGDALLMDEADEEELENMLAEFEAVADEAGNLVHSLFFHTDAASGEVDEGIAVVLNHINLLKANTLKLVVPADCMRKTAYMPPKTSVVDSFLVLDLLVDDLEDIMNRDDNPIADVKDQIQTLHQGLICLQSFIKDTEIGELKECCMRIGDLAREAQYVIVSFLAGEAPSWYLINRLIDVNHKIRLCRAELPEMISGGLKVAKCFNKQLSSSLPKRNSALDDNVVGFEDKMTYILEQLVGGGAELRVISIFGMPGLGKTTLAKKLYYHPLVSERFDRLSWCVVSQAYSKRKVLVNILIHIASDQLSKDVILEMDELSLVENIHKTLKGRRYLIVM